MHLFAEALRILLVIAASRTTPPRVVIKNVRHPAIMRLLATKMTMNRFKYTVMRISRCSMSPSVSTSRVWWTCMSGSKWSCQLTYSRQSSTSTPSTNWECDNHRVHSIAQQDVRIPILPILPLASVFSIGGKARNFLLSHKVLRSPCHHIHGESVCKMALSGFDSKRQWQMVSTHWHFVTSTYPCRYN